MPNKVYDEEFYNSLADSSLGQWPTMHTYKGNLFPPCYPHLRPMINKQTRKKFTTIYHFGPLKDGKVICLRRFYGEFKYLKSHNHFPGECPFCDYLKKEEV